MSFIGGLLGIGGGGGGGSNFQAQRANILQPVGQQDIQTVGNQALGGLDQQQAFLNALANQGALGNQSNVFNQQQALANQLQGVANGTGPNPAMQAFNQATGNNVANQAALMAGQRGVAMNPGLLARQAAMQGAGIQQNAVGQGALLQAQQQLGGMNALGAQQGNMANLAGQQVGQLANANLGFNQAAQSEQQNLLNALGQFNNANVAMQSNLNNTNAAIQNTVAGGQQGLLGGLLGGAGTVLGNVLPSVFGTHKAHGGMIDGKTAEMPMPKYAEGGSVSGDPTMPSSAAGRFLFSSAPANNASTGTDDGSSLLAATMNSPKKQGGGGGGGDSGGLLGGLSSVAGLASMFLEQGGAVPGKAKVSGDSLKNDQVPAMLSPGEIVIPRSIVNSADPVRGAAQFVAQVMAKKRGGKK